MIAPGTVKNDDGTYSPNTKVVTVESYALFAPSLTGPFCQMDRCLEGKMTCGRKLQADMTPEDILEKDYPALWEGGCR